MGIKSENDFIKNFRQDLRLAFYLLKALIFMIRKGDRMLFCFSDLFHTFTIYKF